MGRDKAGKRAKARGGGPPGRHPKAQAPDDGYRAKKPVFSFGHIDRKADARWSFDLDRVDAGSLLEFMCSITSNTWAEIAAMQTGGHHNRKPLHHSQGIQTLHQAAKKDLQRTKLDESYGDEMYRFRLGATIRLWGFRDGHVFHVVWWDDQHQVYATDPS